MKSFRLVPLLFALFLLSSCGEDGVITDPPDPPAGFPEAEVSAGADGLDQLVTNLELAWQQLNYAEYEEILADDYEFRVDAAEVDIVGHATLNLFQDLESAHNLFSGETGLEPVIDAVTGLPTGEFTIAPAVQTIQVLLTADSASSWEQMTIGDLAGTWRRIYSVDMTVTYSGDQRKDQIRGKQIFHAIANADTGLWQIHTWNDQGIAARAEASRKAGAAVAGDSSVSIGSLKAQFMSRG